MKAFTRHSAGWMVAAVASLFWVGSPVANGQAPSPSPSPPPLRSSLAQDLSRAFGFCHGQHLTFAQLRQMHPQMDAQVMLAELKWNSVFQEAEAGLETRLKDLLGDKWEELRAKVTDQEAMLRQQNSTATLEDTRQFLEQVQQRTKGVIESANTLEMLLSCDPQFVRRPEMEMARGFTGTFSSKGHPKSGGLEVTFQHPLSWTKVEGERPHIVQKWTSDGGHGTDVLMLVMRKFPEPISAGEKAEFFTEATAREMYGKDLISYATSTLERMPLGISHFTNTVERLDVKLESRGVAFQLVFEDTLIFLQFMYYTPGGAEAREARAKKLDPLMKMIVGSLVLPASYK